MPREPLVVGEARGGSRSLPSAELLVRVEALWPRRKACGLRNMTDGSLGEHDALPKRSAAGTKLNLK